MPTLSRMADTTWVAAIAGGAALLGATVGAIVPPFVQNHLEGKREAERVRGAARLMQAHFKEVEIPLRVSARRSAWWTDDYMVQRFAFEGELLRLARALEPELWRTV